MGGEIQDTSKKSVLKAIEQADLLQEVGTPAGPLHPSGGNQQPQNPIRGHWSLLVPHEEHRDPPTSPHGPLCVCGWGGLTLPCTPYPSDTPPPYFNPPPPSCFRGPGFHLSSLYNLEAPLIVAPLPPQFLPPQEDESPRSVLEEMGLA